MKLVVGAITKPSRCPVFIRQEALEEVTTLGYVATTFVREAGA
jgi:predicted O-linked N-acetylglucosamine transferase (SPINDLY family)